MAINKPNIPSAKLPNDWGGTQTPYTEQQTKDGYPEAVPTVIDGGNLNFEKRGIFQNIKYLRVFSDWLGNMPIGKIPVVNNQGQLDYDTPVTDSKVVHITGDEDISGSKTFNGTLNSASVINVMASNMDVDNLPSQILYGGALNMTDKNKKRMSFFAQGLQPNGVGELHLIAGNGLGDTSRIIIRSNGTAVAPHPVLESNSTDISTTQWVRSLLTGKIDATGGYFPLPNNVLVQFGKVNSSTSTNVNLPQPFSNSNYIVVISGYTEGTTASKNYASAYNLTTTSFTVAPQATGAFAWIAIGMK